MENLIIVYKVDNYRIYNKVNFCFKLLEINVYKYRLFVCRDFNVKFFLRKKYIDMFVSDIVKFFFIKLKIMENDVKKVILKNKEIKEFSEL